MPPRARTALPRRRPAAEPPTVPDHVEQPAAGQLTPHDVADLINHGRLTVADGDALMDELDQPRLKPARPVTFAVPVAVPVPVDARPAAAMACLDDTVQRTVAAMAWTTLHDIDGYAIDAPHRPGSSARWRLSAGCDLVLVRANIRLTVTVAAYVLHHFADTVSKLLDEDLQHLRDAGVETGSARPATRTRPRRCSSATACGGEPTRVPHQPAVLHSRSPQLTAIAARHPANRAGRQDMRTGGSTPERAPGPPGT
jgi:hypothetical protein